MKRDRAQGRLASAWQRKGETTVLLSPWEPRAGPRGASCPDRPPPPPAAVRSGGGLPPPLRRASPWADVVPGAGPAGSRSAHDKHDAPHDPESPTRARSETSRRGGETGTEAERCALSLQRPGWKLLPITFFVSFLLGGKEAGATFPTGRRPPRAP